MLKECYQAWCGTPQAFFLFTGAIVFLIMSLLANLFQIRHLARGMFVDDELLEGIYYLPMAGTNTEIKMFLRSFHQASTILEFGAGGTTYTANLMGNIRQIYSIEGSSDFVNELLEFPSVNLSCQFGRIQFFTPEYGPLAVYSYPLDKSHRSEWPNYPNAMLEIPANELQKVDLVIIDGRFRVACALIALLETPAEEFLFHDYLNRRDQYRVVEEFFSIEEKGANLVKLRPRQNVDRMRVRQVFEEYKFEPA